MHALRRVFERYNLELEKQDINTIIGLIKQGQSIHMPELEPWGENNTFHYVRYKKLPIKVLYHRSKGQNQGKIITIYPLDVDEYNAAVLKQNQLKIRQAIKLLTKNGYIVRKKEEKEND